MINVALAGDHALNLHALATLFDPCSDIRISSIYRNLRMLNLAIREGGPYPDVIVLDFNFELRPVAEAIRRVKEVHSNTGVIVLGLTRDEEAIGRLLLMGTDRYLTKNTDTEMLVDTVREMARRSVQDVAAGRRMTMNDENSRAGRGEAMEDENLRVGHGVTMQDNDQQTGVVGSIGSGGRVYSVWPMVTDTEYRYLRLAISEVSHDDIRRKLNICESSYTRMVKEVHRRFDVQSRDGLAVALFRRRWLVRDDL
jgi:DNA-binding NarL/FixJ family response regulator